MKSRPSNRSTSKVDMQRLADLAGVSKSTVSRALSDSPVVTDETKQRIRELALEHNYVLNEVARNFRHGKTNIVSVILMIETDSGHSHSYDFFLEMIGSIADALAAAGYDMLLVHKLFKDVNDFVRSRAYQQSEGLIFIGQGHRHEQLNALADSEVPLIVWGAQVPDRRYPVVGGDNRAGAKSAVDHLVSQGYRHIAFFGDKDLPETALRYRGYCDSLENHGLEIDSNLELPVPFEPILATKIVDDFFDQRPHVDGIFCCSDLIALTAISSLAKHGRSVPADVGVVGYDDIHAAGRALPPLTTVNQHIREGGELLVQKLLAQIEGKRVTDKTIPSSLVVRQTSKPARSQD